MSEERCEWIKAGEMGMALIHETAEWAGVQVKPYAILSPGSKINQGSSVHYHAHVGRDTRIGFRCCVAPMAVILEGCTIGDDVLIGAGAVILPGVVIGSMAVVAAGSVVTEDVKSCSMVAGNPAVEVGGHLPRVGESFEHAWMSINIRANG